MEAGLGTLGVIILQRAVCATSQGECFTARTVHGKIVSVSGHKTVTRGRGDNNLKVIFGISPGNFLFVKFFWHSSVMLYTFPASGRRIFVFETGESSEELMSSAQDEGFKKIHLLIFETDLNLTNNSRMVMCRLQLASRKIQKAMDHHCRNTVCPDQSCLLSVRESVFLFGGFLILAHGLDAHCVTASFADFAEQDLLSSTQDERRSTVLDCWQALQHVRDIGWMSWKDGTDDDDQRFLVDEFLHCADSTNGGVHIVAPGQLLLFTDPVDLPDQQQWAVVVSDQDDGSCSRRFSPAFYADLFADLGVAAVVCLTESTTSSAGFAARDIARVFGSRARLSFDMREGRTEEGNRGSENEDGRTEEGKRSGGGRTRGRRSPR